MPDLPKEYLFAADLYWWAFLLTGCEEQGVSMVIELVEAVDDISALGCSYTRPQLRKAIAEKAIIAVPSHSLSPSLPLLEQRTLTSLDCLSERNSGDEVSWAEITAALLCFELLPRRVLLMTILEGYSLTEAASLLGCDENYVAETRVTALCNLTAILTATNTFHFHSN
jgi:hypothetical protein